MALHQGTRLGPYEILTPLGAGGMGEVYKAADTRLNRTVAIKVLPAHLSSDPDRQHRFEREAQTIAALNHAHICALYDVGRHGDLDFLVMEYLDGETLAARLARGALPLDEALTLAIEIADALDQAHGQGVTHRDLKPANVMLTPGGAKLLDFGLAKLQPAIASPGSVISSPALHTTAPGTIMGTMPYMAPEQLEGRDADARTDLFAFGAVLYEMVTGKQAFEGKTQAHLIAAIVSSQPDPIAKTQPGTPAALDFLVSRCLAKDPEQRLQTATDLLWELRWIAAGGSEGTLSAPTVGRRWQRARIAQAALGLLGVVAAALAARGWMTRAELPPQVETRFLIDVPDMPVPEAVTISPDGRAIAYSARDGATTAVFVRPVDLDAPQKLPGTEGAGRLFWSPDSRWIAFAAGGRLKKVEAAGGSLQNVCDTAELLGGTWNGDGVIVFASSKGMHRVLAAGGEATLIAPAGSAGEPLLRREPYFLPDGRHYLFLADGEQPADAAIYAGSLDSTDATRLVAARSNAVYVEPGYLLYHREGTLFAHAFDARRLSLDGEAIRVADRIPYGDTGAAAFAASGRGVLIHRSSPQAALGDGASAPASPSLPPPLLWVTRSRTTRRAAEPARWIGPDLSPDGKRAAVHRHDADGGDIWIFEEGQATPSRFTFDATQDNATPIWSPDGTRIAFSSRRNGSWGLYVKVSDNTRNEELVIESDREMMPMSWTGDQLVYWTSDPRTAGDIWSVPLTGDRTPVALVQTNADERNPQVSPDGKWLAYSSNETGRSEVYIRPFPEGPGRIQVSVNGGLYPRWRRDGRELYFMNLVALGAMMRSDIRVTGASIQRDVPVRLFQTAFVTVGHTGGQPHAFAVTGDGERFFIPQFEAPTAAFGAGPVGGAIAAILPQVVADRRAGSSSVSSAPLHVVLGWTAILNR